jgi:3-oxoacyl-[acyl-carrier-protein] synthase II
VAPFDAQRDGTALGEGAAFLALESAASARARGARVLGIVRGVATGFDPSIRRHGTSDGVALARTVQRAMTDAGVSVAEVSHVQASASGSPLLDAVEAAALATVFGTRVPVTALKGATGELLGASGALQTMAALDVLRTGQLPGCVGLETPLAGVSISLSAVERSVTGSCAVVTAMSAEGTCAALVVGRA